MNYRLKMTRYVRPIMMIQELNHDKELNYFNCPEMIMLLEVQNDPS